MKDVLTAVDQAHMATDDQAYAIHYATQAAKEYLAAHRGSKKYGRREATRALPQQFRGVIYHADIGGP